jgi:membrane-associated phospholipid phosphatase
MNESSTITNPPATSRLSFAWRQQKVYWLVSVVCLLLFAVSTIIVAQFGMPYFPWEPNVTRDLQNVTNPPFEWTMRFISLAGDTTLWFVSFLAAASMVVFINCGRRTTILLLLLVYVGQLVKVEVKEFIARPRPTTAQAQVMTVTVEVHSYPSGHTVLFTVFFGFLWYLTYVTLHKPALRRPLLCFFGFLVLTVGVSRVYLGAHWFSDTVGGYFLGFAILIAGIGLHRAAC